MKSPCLADCQRILRPNYRAVRFVNDSSGQQLSLAAQRLADDGGSTLERPLLTGLRTTLTSPRHTPPCSMWNRCLVSGKGVMAGQRVLGRLLNRACNCCAGIGRSITRIDQIDVLKRPLTMEEGGVVLMDLLWSDPTTNDGVEGVQPSPRGPGLVTFGPDRVKEFCKVGLLHTSAITAAQRQCNHPQRMNTGLYVRHLPTSGAQASSMGLRCLGLGVRAIASEGSQASLSIGCAGQQLADDSAGARVCHGRLRALRPGPPHHPLLCHQLLRHGQQCGCSPGSAPMQFQLLNDCSDRPFNRTPRTACFTDAALTQEGQWMSPFSVYVSNTQATWHMHF